MFFHVQPSVLTGTARPPTSKSHTIRCIIGGTLADGTSVVHDPLLSADGLAPLQGCSLLGGKFFWDSPDRSTLTIEGTSGEPTIPADVINVGNSGTTLYFLTGTTSLLPETTVLTGDPSINGRPIQPVTEALNQLGAQCYPTRSTGTPPVVVRGPLVGGQTTVAGTTSQFTSALLFAAPFAREETTITPSNLQEKPYVRMTLEHLDRFGVSYETDPDLNSFSLADSQGFRSFERFVPGDFSSAAFLLGAGVLVGDPVVVENLDFSDHQADKVFATVLSDMGGDVHISGSSITVKQSALTGTTVDLSQCPDLLPILSVVATQAEGTTQITKVGHARIKETDRISVMRSELTKMGANIEETTDGLIITGGKLNGAKVQGHHDHRIVMALAVAGLVASGETVVDTAEATQVSYPTFANQITSLGATLRIRKD